MIRTTALLIVVLANAALLGQVTHLVPSAQYPTIQSAIVSAMPGDTVLVSPGTYVDHLNFLGKAIEVKGISGAAATTIDAALSGSAARFVNGENASAILNGFTIVNGTGSSANFLAPLNGGGINIYQASPTIKNCVISGNRATVGGGLFGYPNVGGGICVDGLCSPVIANCTIHNNLARVGLAVINGATPDIKGCEIFQNVDGGVTWISAGGSIRRCSIHDHVASGGPGIGISNGGTILIDGCIVFNNIATFAGAAGIVGDAQQLTIVNTLFHHNVCLGNFIPSGAVISVSGGFAAINCTVCDNVGLANQPSILSTGPVTMVSSIIRNGASAEIVSSATPSGTVSYCDIENGWTGNGGANIDIDPIFGAPAGGDYHLQAGSPCIDAGDTAYPGLSGYSDVDGDPRIVGGMVDIGADEFVAHLGSCAGGVVGVGQSGGPFAVLFVNGSSGGANHRVDVAIGTPIGVTMSQPPTNTVPAAFVLWGALGVPTSVDLYSTPFGDLCFAPFHAEPTVPGLFNVTNNFYADATSLVASSPTPWSLSLPAGLPFPFTCALQGLIQATAAPVSGLATTNAVLLVVSTTGTP